MEIVNQEAVSRRDFSWYGFWTPKNFLGSA